MSAATTGVEQPTKKGLPGWLKIGIVLIAVGFLLFGVKQLGLNAKLDAATKWIEGLGASGYLVFVGLYVVATLIGVATPLTLAAGGIWGLKGVLLVSPSSVIAATIAFLLGRYGLRKSVEQKVAQNPKFAAIERAVAKNGFKIVGLVRLSPVFPFTLLNYGLGVTPVKLRDYVLASFLGMLPGTLLYVYLGHIAKMAAAAAETVGGEAAAGGFFAVYGKTIMTVVGLIATIVVTAYVTKIARGALKEELGEKA